MEKITMSRGKRITQINLLLVVFADTAASITAFGVITTINLILHGFGMFFAEFIKSRCWNVETLR